MLLSARLRYMGASLCLPSTHLLMMNTTKSIVLFCYGWV
uniref:Uncharacterized protein n=1 Tax=Aegilops tauschii subsp. strangulata TaxID=200361 RepID=A0A453PU23_AEGTS